MWSPVTRSKPPPGETGSPKDVATTDDKPHLDAVRHEFGYLARDPPQDDRINTEITRAHQGLTTKL